MIRGMLVITTILLCALTIVSGKAFAQQPKDTTHYLTQDDLMAYRDAAPTNIVPTKKAGKPFASLKYNKVIAYDFKGEAPPNMEIVGKNGVLVSVITKQTALSQKQVDAITLLLGKSSTYGGETAKCFLPHLGLVFYNGNEVVMHVSICTGCNFLQSSIGIPATSAKKKRVAKNIVVSMEGFSRAGRKGIKGLCDELGYYFHGGVEF